MNFYDPIDVSGASYILQNHMTYPLIDAGFSLGDIRVRVDECLTLDPHRKRALLGIELVRPCEPEIINSYLHALRSLYHEKKMRITQGVRPTPTALLVNALSTRGDETRGSIAFDISDIVRAHESGEIYARPQALRDGTIDANISCLRDAMGSYALSRAHDLKVCKG